jgi:hypothetical protein
MLQTPYPGPSEPVGGSGHASATRSGFRASPSRASGSSGLSFTIRPRTAGARPPSAKFVAAQTDGLFVGDDFTPIPCVVTTRGLGYLHFWGWRHPPPNNRSTGALMYLRLCSVGLIALAGCAGPTSESPRATAPTDPAPKSTVAGRPYTISVPNMT